MNRTVLQCVIFAGGLALAPLAFADSGGDPDRGKRIYSKCRACHVVDKEKNRVGPHLVGLFGRVSGTIKGFKYSSAMKKAKITWNEETLSGYLEKPRKYVKGTRMSFAELKKEKDRNDLIAYLKRVTAK